MTLKSAFSKTLALATIGAFAIAPMTASADGSRHRDSNRNQWKDLAIVSGIVGILGAASHNNTMAVLGAGGALYSAYRYAEECDSNGRWYHVERGRRVYDRDYCPPVRYSRDWNRSDNRNWNSGNSRDWNRSGNRSRNGGDNHDWNDNRNGSRNSDRGRDRNGGRSDDRGRTRRF